MVGGHIGNHSHIGALVHTDQLEAGQLHNRLIFGLHLTQNGQQRAADVAAQMHGAARRLKHGGNQAGGGGFAVAAGHGDLFAGAVLEEQLHLAAQLGAVLMGLLQCRGVELKAGGPHDDVLPLKTVHVVLAQAQANAQLLQGFAILAERFQIRLFIAQSNLCAHFNKLGDQLFVADTRADKSDFFAAHIGG